MMDAKIGTEGRALLRRIRILSDQHLAADEANRELLLSLIARGHVRRCGPAHSRLTLTAKGNTHLDRLMRCE
ncbi:hypothetical protein AS026_21100 [Rhizobium altiplani]|uniref:Winged helix DNA-binding domain-containing protein n=1 Tax=Rhizobium altiplani TaxID=1864509 RepID=A0A120FF14_9HYPH|nr:hypothetical protein [Rhizobium altiplani]KWV42110.1 hypothetical protein AS026_21100 [Rhizobium altiplani]